MVRRVKRMKGVERIIRRSGHYIEIKMIGGYL